jgi:hypothetical protein
MDLPDATSIKSQVRPEPAWPAGIRIAVTEVSMSGLFGLERNG